MKANNLLIQAAEVGQAIMGGGVSIDIKPIVRE
jgi:hypothetical protein